MSTKSTAYHKQATIHYLHSAREFVKELRLGEAFQAINLAQIHMAHIELEQSKTRLGETLDKAEYLRDCPTCQETGRGLTNEKAEG